MTPAAATTITLSASAASDGGEPTPANDTAFETTTVTATGRNLVVTNTNDSGPGSLRQAIFESNLDSGDRDTIVFNIPGAGVPTITLEGNAGINTIGGSGAGEGNVISGNTGNGITVQSGSNGILIQGNVIGLDAAGSVDLGNTGDGST